MSSAALDEARRAWKEHTGVAGTDRCNGMCGVFNDLIAAERADAVRPWQEQDDAIRATLKRLNPDDKARDIVGSIEQMADAERVQREIADAFATEAKAQRERADGLLAAGRRLLPGILAADKALKDGQDLAEVTIQLLDRLHAPEDCPTIESATRPYRMALARIYECLLIDQDGELMVEARSLITDADLDAARKEGGQ